MSLSSLRAHTGLKMPDAVVVNLAVNTGATLATTDQTVAHRAMELGLEVRSPSHRS